LTAPSRQALAVQCDAEGIIGQLLVDEIHAADHIGPGQSLWDAIDPGSIKDFGDFLAAIRRERAAFDRQIRFRSFGSASSLMLHSAGVAIRGQKILIVGANSFRVAATLMSELLPKSHPNMDGLMAGFREWARWVEQRPGPDDALYTELSRINNELINARRELTKRNAELTRLDAEKNQFIGILAHDLRNPLTVIQAYSSFLSELQGGVIGAREIQFISAIDRSIMFMLGLIDDLLDVSKIAAGRLVLHKKSSDLNAVIEHNLSLNRLLAERKQVRIEYRRTATFSNMLLDVRKIDQVLNNLIDNAIKVSPPRGTVEVRLTREDHHALLRISDQGPGIGAEELDFIFQPFRQGHAGTAKEGKSAGLGLAIANSIVQGHGGRLWAESTPPAGASFFVLLPTLRPRE
jgi:two-component system, OmpR family, sensor kinase